MLFRSPQNPKTPNSFVLNEEHSSKTVNELVNMSSPQRKINTSLLEGQVKDVISSAKTKITDLKGELSRLDKECEDANTALKESTRRKEEAAVRNKELTGEL